jgi:DNA-binding protein YbaB
MAGSLGDLGGLLRQAQKMQRQMADLQEELGKRKFEGKAGGGAVKAVVSGNRKLLKAAEETSQKEMQGLSGGMGLPGMM